jgi:hypothetical protein
MGIAGLGLPESNKRGLEFLHEKRFNHRFQFFHRKVKTNTVASEQPDELFRRFTHLHPTDIFARLRLAETVLLLDNRTIAWTRYNLTVTNYLLCYGIPENLDGKDNCVVLLMKLESLLPYQRG